MPNVTSRRRHFEITATLDPDLLASVDAYVAAHPDLDRNAVIDEALCLWRARELERAIGALSSTQLERSSRPAPR